MCDDEEENSDGTDTARAIINGDVVFFISSLACHRMLISSMQSATTK